MGCGRTTGGRAGGATCLFRTPVFVLTHFERPSLVLRDTTFHYVDASPLEVSAMAKQSANGRDVRIGGGVATLHEFLDAGLIDSMHFVVATVEPGRGERVRTSPFDLVDRFHLEQSQCVRCGPSFRLATLRLERRDVPTPSLFLRGARMEQGRARVGHLAQRHAE